MSEKNILGLSIGLLIFMFVFTFYLEAKRTDKWKKRAFNSAKKHGEVLFENRKINMALRYAIEEQHDDSVNEYVEKIISGDATF